jgi:hypothetical protein
MRTESPTVTWASVPNHLRSNFRASSFSLLSILFVSLVLRMLTYRDQYILSPRYIVLYTFRFEEYTKVSPKLLYVEDAYTTCICIMLRMPLNLCLSIKARGSYSSVSSVSEYRAEKLHQETFVEFVNTFLLICNTFSLLLSLPHHYFIIMFATARSLTGAAQRRAFSASARDVSFVTALCLTLIHIRPRSPTDY